MQDCNCSPGNLENGWHEKRCDRCIEKDSEIWRKSIELAKEFIRKNM